MKPIGNLIEHFWNGVQKTDTCWLWTRNKTSTGYGRFNIPRPAHHVLAHRFAWFLTNGAIPEGLHCLHHCDNPLCVNPSHLFLGNDADNHQDKAKKGRAPRGIAHYRHRLNEEQVIYILSMKGKIKQETLAESFGVTREAISRIHQGKNWKHIPR